MAYTYYSVNYGPKPWQRMLVGEPGGGAIGSAGAKPAFVYVPGGGWGLRDPLPIVDSAGVAAEPIMSGALDNVASSAYESYRVFIPQVASDSHNGFGESVHGLTVWTNTGTYAENDEVVTLPSGTKWRCISGYTATASVPGTPEAEFNTSVNDASATSTSFDTNLTETANDYYNSYYMIQFITGALTGEQRIVSDYVGSSKTITVSSAFSAAPADGDQFTVRSVAWAPIDTSDPNFPRVANRGDGTPSYAFQSALDVRRAVGYIRRRASASDLNITLDSDGLAQVALMGSSAGGQAAGVAAWAEQTAFGSYEHPTHAQEYTAQQVTKPQALCLSITAAKIDSFVTVNEGAGVNGQFLSFMASLYGRSELISFANWEDFPSEIKRSLDPYWAAERSGIVCPTYLAYTGSGAGDGYDDPRTAGQVYNGDTSPSYTPEIHANYHGRVYMERLRSTVAAGGWGNEEAVLLVKTSDSDVYRRYTEYSAAGGTLGVEYTEFTGMSTASTRKQTIGEDIVGFFNANI